jgi:metal-responsive CopG/Arc/MetJ family transcriptional regulator
MQKFQKFGFIYMEGLEGRNNMARVLISMPEEFLTRIDEVADDENRSRSELIREALRTYIHKQRVRENAMAIRNANILDNLLS